LLAVRSPAAPSEGRSKGRGTEERKWDEASGKEEDVVFRFVAVAVLALISGSIAAAARYHWPSPAANFSAYYYRSPGGLGRLSKTFTVYQSDLDVGDSVPHPKSCGSGRTWNGERCVEAKPRK
jgi:hypothetical protein